MQDIISFILTDAGSSSTLRAHILDKKVRIARQIKRVGEMLCLVVQILGARPIILKGRCSVPIHFASVFFQKQLLQVGIALKR